MAQDLAASILDEMRFRAWYADVSKRLGLDPNPDSPEHHYDYRGFYRSVVAGENKPPTVKGGHFVSDFKTDNHPRAFMPGPNGRIYDTRTGTYLTGGQATQRAMDWGNDKPSIVEQAQASVAEPVRRLLPTEQDRLIEQARIDALIKGTLPR